MMMTPSSFQEFDKVCQASVMAVFEHYTHSPGQKMPVGRPLQFMAILRLKEERECLALLCERDGGRG